MLNHSSQMVPSVLVAPGSDHHEASQVLLVDSPAPHPTPGHDAPVPRLRDPEWCLAKFGPFPADNLGEHTQWLTDFARFCAAHGVSQWSVQSYAREHFKTLMFGAEDIQHLMSQAYDQRRVSRDSSLRAAPAGLPNCTPAAAPSLATPGLRPSPSALGWEFQPLTSALLPVPSFTEDLLPAPLRPHLADIAHRIHCPPEWPATAMLASLGAVIGARCGIRPKQFDTSWVEVPNLWGAVVADPSKMKSPAINAGMGPLSRLEKEAQQAHHLALQTHAAETEVLQARKEALRGQLKAAAKEKQPDGLADLTVQFAALGTSTAPVLRRYTSNDSTVEKLTELLSQGSHGLLVYRDELMGLLQSCDKPGHETDRAFYLEAWNGKSSYTSDRIGRGTTHVEHCCVSLFGGIQPDKIEPYLARTAGGQNDGLLQRFQLLTWPDDLPYQYVDAAPNEAAEAEAVALFQRVAAADFTALGATLKPGDTIPCFHFTPDAQAFFIHWLTQWGTRADTVDDAPVVAQHLAKYRKLLPALALLFHVTDLVATGTTGAVSRAAVELAARWCTFLEAHARRLYAYRGGAARSTAVLAAKLQEPLLPSPFKARDVVRHGWQSLTDQRVIEKALDELVANGWLRELTPPAGRGKGRPAAMSYTINPRIRSAT